MSRLRIAKALQGKKIVPRWRCAKMGWTCFHRSNVRLRDYGRIASGDGWSRLARDQVDTGAIALRAVAFELACDSAAMSRPTMSRAISAIVSAGTCLKSVASVYRSTGVIW